jgi:hypothetical protein
MFTVEVPLLAGKASFPAQGSVEVVVVVVVGSTSSSPPQPAMKPRDATKSAEYKNDNFFMLCFGFLVIEFSFIVLLLNKSKYNFFSQFRRSNIIANSEVNLKLVSTYIV